MLLRRLYARTVIAGVVQVRAVNDYRHTQVLFQTIELRVQFRLAVKTAIRRISQIVRVGKFVCRNNFVTDSDLPRDFTSFVQLAGCQAATNARYDSRPVLAGTSRSSASSSSSYWLVRQREGRNIGTIIAMPATASVPFSSRIRKPAPNV